LPPKLGGPVQRRQSSVELAVDGVVDSVGTACPKPVDRPGASLWMTVWNRWRGAR
jgi:hypothetical protein